MTTHRRRASASRSRATRTSPPARAVVIPDDLNVIAAGLLHDMALLQPTERSQFGYKRAAKALVGLPVSVAELVAAGTLGEIPFVGPSTTRIVMELVREGRAVSVEAAVAKSSKADRVAAARLLRGGYLSHHALQSALAAPARGVVGLADYRGDFQMHSTWSDGSEPIASLVEGCRARGHTCLGITDHSYGLPIARGVSMADIVRQHLEIDRINAEYAGRFRVFKGIEANVLADGNLDLTPEERRRFEFVVASPHSLLRRADDQTERMLAAVRGEAVAILGHPRGRVYNSRGGVQADWPRVFAEAARLGVAVELDGNWHRQDLDFALAAIALEAGCLFALDSDAHSIAELRFADYAVAHARLAGIPPDRVINCWSDERLEEWMGNRR